jgi:RHS repeat-associated protein
LGSRTTTAYDAAGESIYHINALGARVSYSYDLAGRQVRLTDANGHAATFLFDAAGQQAAQADGSRTSYSCDATGQLLRERRSGGVLPVNATFSYDQAGNRTQLQAPASNTYYGWDPHGWLTQAEPVAGAVSYSYDGVGRRLRRQDPAATTQFVYDFDKVLQDADGSGDTQRQYASTEGQYGELLSAYGGGEARYYGPDGLGSTDALLAGDGSAPDRYAYRAFGLSSHYQGGDDNRYDWVGAQGYYDDREADLYFLRARYYDPQAGCFLGRDPDGFSAGDANLYRYAGNDPVNRVDPSGKRVLVPECNFLERSFFGSVKPDTDKRPYSGTSDILREQIYSAYNLAGQSPRGRLGFSDYSRVKGREYGTVDLFDGLPAAVWGMVDKTVRSNRLSKLLSTALNEDLVIQGYHDAAHNWLVWSEPEETWGYWLTKKAAGFANALLQAGATLFGGLTRGLKEGVSNLILVGLAALLRQAQPYFPQLNPDDFLKLFNRLSNVGALAAEAVRDPRRLAENLGQGVKLGFAEFFDLEKLPGRLRDAFFDWLFKGLKDGAKKKLVLDLVKNNFKSVGDVATAALALMGLTLQQVFDLFRKVATDKLGPSVVGVLLGGYELVSALVDQGAAGLAGLVQGKVKEQLDALLGKLGLDEQTRAALTDAVTQGLGGEAIDYEAVFGQALEVGAEAAGKLALEALAKEVFSKILALATGGGSLVLDAVFTIYRAVSWVVREAKSLWAFVENVLSGAEFLLQGDNGVKLLAGTVVKGLEIVVAKLLSFLLSLAGLGTLPDKVAAAIETLSKKIQGWLTEVFEGLLNAGQRLLGLGPKVASAAADRGRLTPSVASQPDKSGKPRRKVEVWLSLQNGAPVVMARSNPTELLEKTLGRLKQRGADAKQLGDEEKLYRQTRADGTTLAAPLVGKASSLPPKGQGGAPLRQKEKVAADLQALANGLAHLTTCPSGGAAKAACFSYAVRQGLQGGLIGEARPGRRTATHPGGGGEPARDPAGWRQVALELDYGGGDGVDVLLLREAAWLAGQGVSAGGVMRLDLPEMGAVGWARVKALEACPPLEEGPGRLVTGWFRHWRGEVYELRVRGEAEPIGVTAGHPFWSVDRQAWVAAIELQRGERLLAWDGGTPVVVGLSLRAGTEPVYNIEVEGHHCYRVGQQGLLVHNSSVPAGDPCVTPTWQPFREAAEALRKELARSPAISPGKREFGIAMGRNTVAVAELILDGKKVSTLNALSGGADCEGLEPYIPNDQRVLKCGKINGAMRDVDAEAKILESVLKSTKESDKGCVLIFVDGPKPVCKSCKGVIEEFMKMRLCIPVIVEWRGGASTADDWSLRT